MTPDIQTMLTETAEWRARVEAKRRPAGDAWYSVSNIDSDRASVRIYDEIGGWGVEAEAFAADMAAITSSEIEVAINSPGGSVMDGLAIYNTLRTHPARIITRVDGLAASAASFIAQAGDERVMVGSSQMMIHDARAVVAGDAETMRYAADFLEKQSRNIAALYAERAGVNDTDHYAALMAAETWMSADEAVEQGLADSVLTPARQGADNRSNISPQDAATKSAADAADLDAASLVESKQAGERAAFLRSLQLAKRN